jgi:hypothetical protein
MFLRRPVAAGRNLLARVLKFLKCGCRRTDYVVPAEKLEAKSSTMQQDSGDPLGRGRAGGQMLITPSRVVVVPFEYEACSFWEL